MNKLPTLFFVLILNSCGPLTNYEEGPIISPDSNLELLAYVNRTDNSKPNFARVVLTVNDKTNGRTTELVTGIGDAMKWAIGWYDNNIIVAQSSDIGTRCWKFTNEHFEELSVTSAMQEFAEQLRIEKYNLDE